jgi:hypothetical protein
MEEEAMDSKLNSDHFLNEENLDAHGMNPSSPMYNLELVSCYLICFVVINSPILIKIDQGCFPIPGGSFNKTSCSKISYDFLLSSNDEYVMKYISDSHIL